MRLGIVGAGEVAWRHAAAAAQVDGLTLTADWVARAAVVAPTLREAREAVAVVHALYRSAASGGAPVPLS